MEYQIHIGDVYKAYEFLKPPISLKELMEQTSWSEATKEHGYHAFRVFNDIFLYKVPEDAIVPIINHEVLHIVLHRLGYPNVWDAFEDCMLGRLFEVLLTPPIPPAQIVTEWRKYVEITLSKGSVTESDRFILELLRDFGSMTLSPTGRIRIFIL